MTVSAADNARASTLLHGPLFYLTGEYPRATDTFIQREVAALRALGVDIRTCSVRRTPAVEHVGATQRTEAAKTFYIQPVALHLPSLIVSHATVLLRSPRCYIAAFILALRSGAPGAKGFIYQMFYFGEAGVLAARLRREGAVHLHNHFGNSSCSVAMLASAIAGVPYSYTLHGPSELFEPMRWRIDLKIARAAFVACISNFARSQAMLFSNQRHWEKLKIIHCGVDPARYDTGPRIDEGKQILFVGRLAAVKGIPLLLEALARLRTAHPSARLTLVGDGPDRQVIEAQVAQLSLEDMVDFAGYADEDGVAVHLARADLFVLPSFAEGVPVVLMEAMAARLPVIASQVAGVPELVVDGESGFLVPPGDVETLAARIEMLLADPDRRRVMGEAGREKVIREYSSAQQAEHLHALFAGSTRTERNDHRDG